MSKNIKLEILEASYYEHFKYAKDIAMFLPVGHYKRVVIDKELQIMITEINNIRNLKD
jgi:hypothetical protein